MMQIPDGYALVKLTEVPAMIRDSIRHVLKQKQLVLAERSPNGHGGSDWSPLYNGQERSEAIIREMGNNAAQGVATLDESEG
jgi:hypothetical protein